LSQKGFGAVQTSPPNENAIIYDDTQQRPWWERYQPVSYMLETRSGTTEEFASMVQRCNAVGVRIYNDVVFNHMTGGEGNVGTYGSSYDPNAESYPAVPYTSSDFDDSLCTTSSGNVECYTCDADQVRNCKLTGLVDLHQGQDNVQTAIVNYLNTLIAIGVGGFRVDAAKNMWPGDLTNIYDSLNDLNSTVFGDGARPFIYQEVSDFGGESTSHTEYTPMARVTEFWYGMYVSDVMRGEKEMQYLVNFGEDWDMMASGDALAFIDNHDNQRSDPDDIVTFRLSKWYKMAVGYMLAWPYGVPRVMSSFDWTQDIVNGADQNSWQGPPHDSSYNTESPTFDDDGACTNGWICEHRWRQIYNMAVFNNLTQGTEVENWWDNAGNQIAFSRGSAGFVAFNNDNYDLQETLQTGMAAGTYCEIISGNLEDGACTGSTVTVDSDGNAYIEILTDAEDGILAFHSGVLLS